MREVHSLYSAQDFALRSGQKIVRIMDRMRRIIQWNHSTARNEVLAIIEGWPYLRDFSI